MFVTNDRFDYEEFNTVLTDRRTPKAISGHSMITANFETAYVAMHDVGDTESADSLTAIQLMAREKLAEFETEGVGEGEL